MVLYQLDAIRGKISTFNSYHIGKLTQIGIINLCIEAKILKLMKEICKKVFTTLEYEKIS